MQNTSLKLLEMIRLLSEMEWFVNHKSISTSKMEGQSPNLSPGALVDIIGEEAGTADAAGAGHNAHVIAARCWVGIGGVIRRRQQDLPHDSDMEREKLFFKKKAVDNL